MKRALSLVLALIILLSSTACTKGTDKMEEAPDSDKNIQNYDDLEYKSTDRFTDSDILSFKCKEGSASVQPDSMVVYAADGVAAAVPFEDPQQHSYSEVEMPFGAEIGGSAKSFAKSFSLDTGYAAYVEMGSDIVMYEEGKLPDFKESGFIYFGYALDGTGKWAFMDYYMLIYLMRGQLDVRGFGDDYNVVIYCCSVDSSANVASVTQLYGNIASVMAITSGQ